MVTEDSNTKVATVRTPRFLTVRQLVQRYEFLSEGGLRWALFHREHNGLSRCIRYMGRKILIDEAAFLEWLEKRGNTPLHATEAR